MIPVADLQAKIRKATDTARLSEDPKFYAEMVELEREVLDLLRAYTHLQDELKALRNLANTEKQLVREKDCYYLTEGPEDRRGPYCVKCWDDEKKLISMVKPNDWTLKCPKCNHVVPTGQPPIIGRRARTSFNPEF